MGTETENTEKTAVMDTPAATTASAGESAPASKSKIVAFYAHPWTQILLISFICFCLPGVRREQDTLL
jgi:hypothetical protein